MEFIDIALLTGDEPSGLVLDFGTLRNLPKVQISMDMQLIPTPENLERLKETAAAGTRVANVTKVNLKAQGGGGDDFPRRILFEMTSICNVLCKMCPRNHLLRPAMHMDADVYCNTLAEINEHGIEGLWLYHLGESLMHPDFRKIVDHVGKLGNFGYVWMSTNGHLMNESNIKFILDSRIDYINYSLHGISPEAHKAIIPLGNFARVLHNYEKLLDLKGRQRHRKPYIHLQMIEQQATRHEVTPFIEQHIEEVEIVSVNMLEYVNLPENSFGHTQRKRPEKGHCKRVRNSDCFICSNGAVTLCDAAYNCAEEYVGDLYLGNINDSSLYSIWNGERRKRLIDMEAEGKIHMLPLCSNCTDYDF